jgi:hypothetical protein
MEVENLGGNSQHYWTANRFGLVELVINNAKQNKTSTINSHGNLQYAGQGITTIWYDRGLNIKYRWVGKFCYEMINI